MKDRRVRRRASDGREKGVKVSRVLRHSKFCFRAAHCRVRRYRTSLDIWPKEHEGADAEIIPRCGFQFEITVQKRIDQRDKPERGNKTRTNGEIISYRPKIRFSNILRFK